MQPAVDVWWTLGDHAENPRAATTARDLTAVPLEWRRGRRGRFLADIARRSRGQAPRWSAGGSARGWRFNLSAGQHLSLTDSGRHLIVAVGQGVPIGIDAERLRPIDDPLGTLSRLGLGDLAGRLGRLGPAARNRGFVHVWTAFEAFLKLERLPWDAAASEFGKLQGKWLIETSGRAYLPAGAGLPVAFAPVYAIPGIVLTVATPFSCRIEARRWEVCPGCHPGEEFTDHTAG